MWPVSRKISADWPRLAEALEAASRLVGPWRGVSKLEDEHWPKPLGGCFHIGAGAPPRPLSIGASPTPRPRSSWRSPSRYAPPPPHAAPSQCIVLASLVPSMSTTTSARQRRAVAYARVAA
eukprot:scaffold24519_cov60-Phaeocystis_antarctica.AAC.5